MVILKKKCPFSTNFKGMFHFSMALYTKELDKTGSNQNHQLMKNRLIIIGFNSLTIYKVKKCNIYQAHLSKTKKYIIYTCIKYQTMCTTFFLKYIYTCNLMLYAMCITFSFTRYPRDIYVILGHDNSTLVVGRCITCNKMNATVVPAAQIILHSSVMQ